MTAPESSRARQEAEQEPESEPRRKWVALVSVVNLPGNEDDKRAQHIVVRGNEVLLDLNNLPAPPLPSYLVLHPADARRNDGPLSAYILAALDRSPYILLQFVEDNRPDFFLCNTDTRAVDLLPPVPANIQARGHDIRRNLSIGLIANQNHPGDYVVAQLHPSTSINEPDKLLYYSTAKDRWFARGLYRQQAPMRNPFSETGVLAHDGRLWWISLAYGVFFCDPCTRGLDTPELRFLPLPSDSESVMMEDDIAFDPRIRTLLGERRCVRPSDGKLRFVEIRGLSYADSKPAASPTVWMWTLEDPEAADPNNAWTFAYKVAFADIWNSETYADEGLPREVPHVALVDPDNHFVVYFFQGSKLFGFHMRDMKVVACKDFVIDRDQLSFRSSRPIVDAWVPPPPPPPPPQLPGDDDDLPPDVIWKPKPWVVLSSIPVVIGFDDGRTASFLPGMDMLLDLHDPPHPSYVLVPEAMAPNPRWPGTHPYIVACDSSARLVVHATQGEGVFDNGLFLCDSHDGAAIRLPPPPPDLGVQLHRRVRNFGLIPNPHRIGHYLIAQLHPTPSTHHESLLFYCTATKTWGSKKFVSSPEHRLWGEHGVIAYNELLWWVDAAFGMLVCDPFLNQPHLRLVPLPDGCEMKNPIIRRSLIDGTRIVRCSEGKLRFVELKAQQDFPENATVCMWTLLDQVGPRWQREYEISFADIWANESYLAANLPPGKLPKLALVDPNNCGIIYFFQDKSLFALDVGEKQVVACEDAYMQIEEPQELRFQNSRFVDAWELPPGLGDGLSCDGSSEKVPTHLLGGNKGNIIIVNKANPLVSPLPTSVLPEEMVASSINAKKGLKTGKEKLESLLKEHHQDGKARRKLLREQAYIDMQLESLIDSDDD